MISMNVLTTSSYIDLVNATFNHSFLILSSTRGTTTIDNESTPLMPLWIRIITLTCMIVIDVCAFFGNLLVICAFFRTRRLQTVTNYFIASLAFADALVAIFVLPLGIYVYQKNRSWKLGLILCDLWVSSDVLLCTSSILNLTCISVDRYMAITRPLTYTAYRSKFLARVMILLVWIVSAVITCPPIFGWRDPNRRQMVEEEHKCDLNTARGYVVYSALGSFYIPAVVMIFVYIRIFMVVYDRENLIKKFHEKDHVTSVPAKYQNGSANSRAVLDGNAHDDDDLIDRKHKVSCLCSCWKKSSRSNHQLSVRISSPISRDSKQSQQRTIAKTHSVGSPAEKRSARMMFYRPCSLINRRKEVTLDEKLSRYRRQYASGLGAEYRFRTGDSPCYERKTFVDSVELPNQRRSHSLEDLSNYNTSFTDARRKPSNPFVDRMECSQLNGIDNNNVACEANDSPNHDRTQELMEIQEKQNNTTLSKASDDIVRLSLLEPTKSDELRPLYTSSKRSPTLLTCSSFIGDGHFTQSTTYSTLNDHKSASEQKLLQNRSKSFNLNQSQKLIDQVNASKPRSKATLNHSSLRSNHSIQSIRRFNEQTIRSRACRCSCCFTPVRKWYEKKSKHIYHYTPNHSLTNDDEDDEKVSSNDVSNRLTATLPSHSSLRAIDSSNQPVPSPSLLSSSHQLSSGVTTNASNDAHRRERIRFLKEQKTAKTLAVVVGGFILFWLPFFIMYVIPPEAYVFSPQTVALITWLGYCNSVINPFIYAYCSKQFRMAFWNLTFGTCLKKSNPFLPIVPHTNHYSRRPMNTNSVF